MCKCSNCEQEYKMPELVVRLRGEVIADICEDCLKNVLTMKVVFKRSEPADGFAFEQYLPVESAKV